MKDQRVALIVRLGLPRTSITQRYASLKWPLMGGFRTPRGERLMAKERSKGQKNTGAPTEQGTGLAEYWNGVHKALHARLLGVKKQLRKPTSGTNAERLVHELLADYLPRRFSVESGYVVSADARKAIMLTR
jgi:hypothetical protein